MPHRSEPFRRILAVLTVVLAAAPAGAGRSAAPGGPDRPLNAALELRKAFDGASVPRIDQLKVGRDWACLLYPMKAGRPPVFRRRFRFARRAGVTFNDRCSAGSVSKYFNEVDGELQGGCFDRPTETLRVSRDGYLYVKVVDYAPDDFPVEPFDEYGTPIAYGVCTPVPAE